MPEGGGLFAAIIILPVKRRQGRARLHTNYPALDDTCIVYEEMKTGLQECSRHRRHRREVQVPISLVFCPELTNSDCFRDKAEAPKTMPHACNTLLKLEYNKHVSREGKVAGLPNKSDGFIHNLTVPRDIARKLW